MQIKQKLIGTFFLAPTNVQLYAKRSDSGGEFYFSPDDKSLPRIKACVDYAQWDDCLAVLLHESFEYLMTARKLRYVDTGKMSGDSADFLFIFNHSQFSDICAAQAYFLQFAIPALRKEWERAQPKKRK